MKRDIRERRLANKPRQVLSRGQRLKEIGAVLTNDHFVYTSGIHGSAYVNKDAVFARPGLLSKITLDMARRFRPFDVEVVIGPEKGGIILSQWVAFHLQKWNYKLPSNRRREIFSVFAEKDGNSFILKRGYSEFIRGKKVLVVEDVLTTGGSVSKVVDLVKELGGEVIGLSVFCNRGALISNLRKVPRLESTMDVELETWTEDECPLCAQGVPINTELGKGAEFLAQRAKP